jgi:hypothetical protein
MDGFQGGKWSVIVADGGGNALSFAFAKKYIKCCLNYEIALAKMIIC